MNTIPQNYTVQEKLMMLRKQYTDMKQKEKDDQNNRRERALRGSASKRHMWLYADGIEKMNIRNRLHEEKMQEEFWDHSSCASSYTSRDRYRFRVEKSEREKREISHLNSQTRCETSTAKRGKSWDML
ncbi:predicted protein [Chaetoceros tenuissimus]|uniref:Uncharacterized protein n=1 Tax=Chaetoceros tenuissimus TaxID=426638 RepID=A0AAD3H966_9STRA|nr:predicted protein [Chaetoceros tenuissimus]